MSLGTSFAFICSWFLQRIEDVIFGRLFWTRLVPLHFLEWIVANSHYVVEHPLHVMPFLGKGEWPLEFELVEQSSSTLMWYIQIGHVGLHHSKWLNIFLSFSLYKSHNLIPNWNGKYAWLLQRHWFIKKLVLILFYFPFSNLNITSSSLWSLISCPCDYNKYSLFQFTLPFSNLYLKKLKMNGKYSSYISSNKK